MSERRQRRANEILAAAREVFLEKGFERTAVSEVASRVGIVEGLVFSYFPTKRDLLHEVLGAMYEPLIRDVGDGYARLKGLRAPAFHRLASRACLCRNSGARPAGAA